MAKTKKLIMAAFFCALTAVLSQLCIPVGPVPISLSLIAVYLTGVLSDKKYAFFAQLAYLIIGAAGFPVFAGAAGGLPVLLGPTGGYLLSYPVAAFLISFLSERLGRSVPRLALSMLAALTVCYIFGLSHLTYLTGSFFGALSAGIAPFLLPDLVKTALCAPLGAALCRALKTHIIS